MKSLVAKSVNRHGATSLRTALTVVGCLALATPARADLKPKTMTLPAGQHAVADILRELEKQTGNRVIDRRADDAVRTVQIGFDGQTFWQSLDRLIQKLDARMSLYGDDSIRLIDGPRRTPVVADAGLCRVEIKSIAVQRDLESDRRTCTLQLDVAWEPRFEPLYLTVDGVKATYAADGGGKERTIEPMRGVAQSVAQRRAQTIELRLPGPDRSSPRIASMSGDLKFLGPTRMVTATFANLKSGPDGRQVVVDGVTVTLRNVAANKQNWTFDLDIENPVGMPAFESFQSWIDNNRIHLERIVNGKKEVWSPRPDDWTGDLNGRRAKLTYVFASVRDKGDPGDWTLVYRTPGRIVELTIPFEFRDVALP